MHNYFLSHAQVPQLLLFCEGITALSHKTHTWATIHLLMRTSLGAFWGEVASTISYIKWSVARRKAPHALTLYCYYLLVLYHAPTLSDVFVLLQLLNFQYIYKCTKPGICTKHGPLSYEGVLGWISDRSVMTELLPIHFTNRTKVPLLFSTRLEMM